jgi:hypothetical protein
MVDFVILPRDSVRTWPRRSRDALVKSLIIREGSNLHTGETLALTRLQERGLRWRNQCQSKSRSIWWERSDA